MPCTTIIPSAASASGSWASGVNRPCTIVSTMRPSSRVMKIARAKPMSSAAYAMDRNPATSASAVPPTPSPPTSRDHAHREEQRCHLVEPPAEPEHPDHERGERDEHQREDRAATTVQRAPGGTGLRARCGAGAGGVAPRAPDPDAERGREEGDPNSQPESKGSCASCCAIPT